MGLAAGSGGKSKYIPRNVTISAHQAVWPAIGIFYFFTQEGMLLCYDGGQSSGIVAWGTTLEALRKKAKWRGTPPWRSVVAYLDDDSIICTSYLS
jgi:hypothetical protein